VHDHRVRILRRSVTDILAAGSSGLLTDERAHRAQRDLTEFVATLETDAETTRIGRSSASRIAQKCIAVADSLDPIPRMLDLASAIGVSDRWIRAAFREVYGISPSAFFRVRAMNGAHRQLRSARPDSVTVTEVAMAWGFWLLGRLPRSLPRIAQRDAGLRRSTRCSEFGYRRT
jgi:AraC-like DNA-binding protein